MLAYRKVRHAVIASLMILMGSLVLTAALALSDRLVWPYPSGEKCREKGVMTVDASSVEDGYIMVKREACSSKLKLRISKGDTTYTYDLNSDGLYEVFPLQMGSGSYTCSLYKNVKGNKYSKEAEVDIKANLTNEFAAFLCPSQYVYYTQESPAVQASEEICAGLETDAEKMEAIREYMANGFAYDFVRALTISDAYLGDVDGCFEKRMGLCQDLAVVAACMLRVQGIPTQLVIGYAGDIYHAWNNVLIDGEYQRLDITAELGGMAPDIVYTAERYY